MLLGTKPGLGVLPKSNRPFKQKFRHILFQTALHIIPYRKQKMLQRRPDDGERKKKIQQKEQAKIKESDVHDIILLGTWHAN